MKVLIIGAGKFGYKLAEEMLSNDMDVTIMDTNPKILERIDNQLDVLTVTGNGVQLEMLRKLEIYTYDFTVAVTNSDETNIVICSIVKKMGCKKTVARVRNPEYVEELKFIKEKMEIDYIVNPELAIATEISRYLLKKYSFYANEFVKGKVSMIDINVNEFPECINKKVLELDGMEDILITAISRDGDTIIPNGKTILNENDTMYVIGTKKAIKELTEKSTTPKFNKNIRRVMILGGGKIGYYLAKKLIKEGIHVKIIEQNADRCEYLSETLEKALVINGDGSDINLLEEEDIKAMDALVCATDFDEVNLLMSILSKQSGVKEVISKVSRPNYGRIIRKLGVDVALNPINISVSNILKFIQGGKIIAVSLLLGDQAEVFEIIASQESPIVGKPISQLKLPRGIIIGAISHNGKVIIPTGDTIIYPNDRLVIFCLKSEIPTLESFIMPRRGGFFSKGRIL